MSNFLWRHLWPGTYLYDFFCHGHFHNAPFIFAVQEEGGRPEGGGGRKIFAIIIIILVLHTKAICHKPELELRCKTKNSDIPSVFNSWDFENGILSIKYERTYYNGPNKIVGGADAETKITFFSLVKSNYAKVNNFSIVAGSKRVYLQRIINSFRTEHK